MIGVIQPGQRGARIARRRGEATMPGGDRRQRVIVDRADAVAVAQLQPELVEIQPFDILSMRAERVEIPVAAIAPADELDPQFHRTAGRAQEIRLVDAQPGVEATDRRNRRLANADRADRIGFDQRDGALAIVEETGGGGRRHPAGGAAADDHHAANGRPGHARPRISIPR